jgi:hypothetical protein
VSTLTKILKVTAVAPYKLRLEFADGTRGTYDCGPMMIGKVGAMLAPLQDPAYFARVFLEMGATTWPNGFDLAPWALQKELEVAGLLEPAASSGQDAAE